MSENLGKVNFSSSIICYFTLIADFGIATYAAREGAKFRNDKGLFDNFVSNVFTINCFSTLFSYFLLVLFLFSWDKLDDYSWILVVQSGSLIFNLVGSQWINTVYEDFKSILFRSIFVQIASLILLFILVKSKDDYLLYASVSIIAQGGANLLNFFYIRKYASLRFKLSKEMLNHLKPLLIILCTSITTTIYVNSDITMIGIYLTDVDVALYSVSVKIYTVVKAIFAAIIIVEIPRLTELYNNKENSLYKKVASKTGELLLVFLVPIVLILILLSSEAVLVISNEEFLSASTSLIYLCFAILASLYATFLVDVLILPQGLEKGAFYASIISAFMNVILNLILIPLWGILGAALTTILSELLVCVVLTIYACRRNHRNLELLFNSSLCKNISLVVVALVFMMSIGLLLSTTLTGFWLRCVLIPSVCFVCYTLMLFAMKQETVLMLYTGICSKILRKK